MEATSEGKLPVGNNTLVRLIGEGARQTAGFARSGPAQWFPPAPRVWPSAGVVSKHLMETGGPIGSEPVVEEMQYCKAHR
jgi:hypothetical protein